MAGHSKWSKVKHIKGPLDVKRGALFSRLVRGITLNVRLDGGNPAVNIRLRAAIDAADAGNMSKDNIKRAVENDTGEFGGSYLEEITYEGYAPIGVALIVATATDNGNRTAADIHGLFAKHHGSPITADNVFCMFHKKAEFVVTHAANATEERLLELTRDAGTEDITDDENCFIPTSPPDRFYAVNEALPAGGIAPGTQRLPFVPDLTVPVTDEALVGQVPRLCGAPGTLDNALNVHSNFDIAGNIASRPQG